LENAQKSAVIIDNFSPIDHRRLLKELISIFPQARIIALQRASSFGADVTDDDPSISNFKFLKLHGLSRPDIRNIINAISPRLSSDVTSTVVNKVYADLLQLCIPLTPSNVIMYASVLCRDGSFIPVSRLHIVDRFVTEALQRASDVYSESFNYIDKLEVVSEFCYGLFSEDKSSFDLGKWNVFCARYKKDNLVDFDHIELLNDLADGRIIIRLGATYQFKYKMFFSYFVGKRIASNSDLLEQCLAADRHLELDGLVEVLCGTLPDCSNVLTHITSKVEQSLSTFYEKYPLNGLDLHVDAKWEITSEEENVWKKIADRVEEAPTGTAELDELKTSLTAERRTEDQKVSIIKFIVSETSVSVAASRLRTAIENAKSARADIKKAAVDAVINSYILTYELATILSPLIAEKKYVSWNGFTYVNLIEDEKVDADQNQNRMLMRVVSALPTSISQNAAEALGSRKLGQVFLAINNGNDQSSFRRLVILSLLLRSKPTGWLEIAKKMIKEMKKDEIYLRHFLSNTLEQLKTEINTSAETAQLKGIRRRN
jgi:hypothetical protein